MEHGHSPANRRYAERILEQLLAQKATLTRPELKQIELDLPKPSGRAVQILKEKTETARKLTANKYFNIVEPMIYDGTTYLPVRALTNMLTDKDIAWDGSTQSIYIGKKPADAEYRRIVQELINKYNLVNPEILKNHVTRMSFGDSSQPLPSGVYGVKQLDFDNDGKNELFVLWKETDSGFSAAIYTMEDDTAVRKWYAQDFVGDYYGCGLQIYMAGKTPIVVGNHSRHFKGPVIFYHDGVYKDLADITFTAAERNKISAGIGLGGEGAAEFDVMLSRVGLTQSSLSTTVFDMHARDFIVVPDQNHMNRLRSELKSLGIAGY